MARTVDYLPVAIETGSNVEGQSSFAIDPIRLTGHQAGVAKSAVANKMWRQSSVMVAALANLLMEALDVDILDDGDVNALKTRLQDVLMGGRTTIMNSDTDFYISATGNDGPQADGLTQSTAFATLQHAFDYVLEKFDLNGFTAYFNIGSGQNFAGVNVGSQLQGQSWSGGMTWRGAGIGATRINSVNDNCFEITNQADALILDCALTATGSWDATWTGYGLWGGAGCTVNFDRLDFQACSCHMSATMGTNMYTFPFENHSYTVSGGARVHIVVNLSSLFSLYQTTVTVTGNPNFSQVGVYCWSGGNFGFGTSDCRYNGASTGQRFWVDRTSHIGVAGLPETVLPGNTSGFIQAEVDSNYFDGIRV